VRVFFDTSVLLAAFLESDLRHSECRALLLHAHPERSACGTHSFAEFYSVFTRLPRPLQLAPEQAWLLVEELQKHITPIALTAPEYLRSLKRMAEAGIGRGQTYDALLLACARKYDPDRIYSLNWKHLSALAPDLADRIVSP
jgi:predicted nucleic acid-binding protein